MSPDDGASTSPADAPVGRRRRGGGASGSSAVLMVALLALGAVLGAVGWDLLEDEGRSRGEAASSVTTTTAPPVAAGESDEDRLICVAALERSVEATELVGDGLQAVAELRRTDLDRVLNRLQQLRPGLRSSAEQCRKILQG